MPDDEDALPTSSASGASAPSPRFAVAGASHLHLHHLVERLAAVGAQAVAHTDDGELVELYEGWQPGSERRPLDDIVADGGIDLVVTAAVPRDRARIALAALEAGKAVLSDKPGVTTHAQLADVRAAVAGRPGRPWTVLFSERFENRAIAEAVRIVRAGAIGDVVHVVGAGPHTLAAARRPPWFWDQTATGGILVDIGSHQVDQFLAVTGAGATDVQVIGAMVGNVGCPDRPGMQDVGSMTLGALGVVGDHRLDYLTAPGLGAWGDVRLTVVGTAGTVEARANVDPGGEPGGEHLIVVDADGTRRVDLSGVAVDWARLLVADVADSGERLMTQQHVLDVCDVTLRAQAQAGRWGGRG